MIQRLNILPGPVSVLIRGTLRFGRNDETRHRQAGSPPAAFITPPGSGTVTASTSTSLLLCWGERCKNVSLRVKYCGGKDVKKSQCRWSNRGGCERARWCWHQAERRAEIGNVVCNKEVWESMITSPEEQTTHIQPLWSGFNHNHSWKKDSGICF